MLFRSSPAMSPYLQFSNMRPTRVIAGEILEFDGDFSVKRIASVSHLVMANTLLREGKPDQALPQAEQAVALAPDMLYTHEELLDAYAANHQMDHAMAEYRTSLLLFHAVDPAFAEDVSPPDNPLTPSH